MCFRPHPARRWDRLRSISQSLAAALSILRSRSSITSTEGVFRTVPFRSASFSPSPMKAGSDQMWGSNESKYFDCTSIDCILSTSFSNYFLFLLPTFVHIYLYFVLLTLGVTVILRVFKGYKFYSVYKYSIRTVFEGSQSSGSSWSRRVKWGRLQFSFFCC